MNMSGINGYTYTGASLNPSHRDLLPVVLRIVQRLGLPPGSRRVFDLGCGNGSVGNVLSRTGFDVIGVDSSLQGIEQAKRAYPHLKLFTGSAYEDLVVRFGRFPVVVSLEVVEHLYAPRKFAATLFDLLEPGGVAIVSTPYHGYWKNLVLAISGKMDQHFTALWNHGHIKFWSMKTLQTLLDDAGLRQIHFYRAGRIPILAKSMIAVAQRPIV